jgi:hypothetical protein
LYGATFYLLPVHVAAVVRLLMLAAAVVGPLLAFRRVSPAGSVALASFLASAGVILLVNPPLLLGLTFMSTQELPGAACVGLAIWCRRDGAALFWLVAAAWFKSPFAVVLVAWGAVLLWRRHKPRWLPVTALALGIGTLLAAALMSRLGSYTQSYGNGLTSAAVTADWNAVQPDLTRILLLVAVTCVSARALPKAPPMAIAALAGAVGYAVILLPWGRFGGYYVGPVLYLVAVGLLFLLATVPLTRWVPAAVGVAVLLLALPTLRSSLQEHSETEATDVGLAQFLTAHADATVGVNAVEPPVRLGQIEQLRHGDVWHGTVVEMSECLPRCDYLVQMFHYLPEPIPTSFQLQPVRDYPQGRVYRPVAAAR